MASDIKASIWGSIKSNPKVLFIAFFASYESPTEIRFHLTNNQTGSVVSNMVTSKVSWDRVW